MRDMKKILVTLILISTFVIPLVTGLSSIRVCRANPMPYIDPKIDFFISPPLMKVESPNNYTIYKNVVPINISISDLGQPILPVFFIGPEYFRYSADNGTIADFPNLRIFSDSQHSEVLPSQSMLLDVSNFSDGIHQIQITVGFLWWDSLQVDTAYFSFEPIYFTVYNTPPRILVLSPENETYDMQNLSLNLKTDRKSSWIGYSLDNQANVTTQGNSTLAGLIDGQHNIVVYANDTVGNMGTSKTIYFTIDAPPSPSPSPTQRPSPSATQQPTPTPTPPSTSDQQTPSPEPQPTNPQTEIIYATVAIAATATVIATTIIILKKRRHPTQIPTTPD